MKIIVRGSSLKHPGKMEVLKKIKQGEIPTVHIVHGEAFFEGQSAGLLETFIEEGEATAIKAEGTVYIIELKKGELKKESIEAIKEEIIAKYSIPEKEINERIEYLKNNNVSDEQIIETLKFIKKYPSDVEGKIPTLDEKQRYRDSQGVIRKAVCYINAGEHIKFEGEKGVGKNVLVSTLAWLYRKPLYEISMNVETDKMDLQGNNTLEENKNGKVVVSFQKSELVKAIENDGFLNLDEINVAKPEVLVWLHYLIDNRRRVSVSGYKDVVATENFRMLLTLNKGYIGTYDLNEATNDRFVTIVVEGSDLISPLLKEKYPYVDDNCLNICDKIYETIKKSIKNGELSASAITIRGFETVAKTYKVIGIKDALIDNIANKVQDESEREILCSLIEDIIG